MCVFCMIKIDLWKGKRNIIHWQQSKQGHSSVSVSSLDLLEYISCQRIRSNDWTLLLFVANISWIAIGDDLWHVLWNCCQYFKPCLTFFSPNYSWLIYMQMLQLLYELKPYDLFKNSFHLFSWFIFELCLLIQLLNFTCWFGLFFANHTMMFITLNGRKCFSCWILFWDETHVVPYLIVGYHKYFSCINIMLIIDVFLKLCKVATQELSYFKNQMTQCNIFL